MTQETSEPNLTPESVLVRLKNKICLSLGIDIYRLKSYIDYFVTNNFTDIGGLKAHYTKVNLLNEISTKDRISWKVFFKFLRIICVKKIVISLTIEHGNKTITVNEEIKLLNLHTDIEEIERKK